MTDITVVIPTISIREAMLARALASVQAQTLPAQSTVIVHDLDREGHAATRTAGLNQVTTEFTAFLDDDDELYPQHLEVLRNNIGDADLAYSWFDVQGGTDPLACPVDGVLQNPFGVPFGDEQSKHLQQVGNFIPVTTLVRTKLAQEVGGFPNPNSDEWPWPLNEDWGFLIKLLERGARFVHVPEKTWRWHHHGANTSGQPTRW